MATNYNNNYTNYPNYAQPHLQAPRPLMTTTGYPPQQDGMYATLNSTTTLETKVADDPRLMNRTPSPTPSEARELKTGAIDWKQISSTKFWFRREWLCACAVPLSCFPFADALLKGTMSFWLSFLSLLRWLHCTTLKSWIG